MTNRHLFLFGGSPPFNRRLGKKFADYSLGDQGMVAILFIKRDGWERYMEKYTSVLQEYGVKHFKYIPLTSNPKVETLNELKSCTGIIISGGETELYHTYIVETNMRELMIYMYNNGVPIAGFSAGALISPENCVIPPIDTISNKHLFLKGLGLIKECIISVHFSTWNEEENVRLAMEKLRVPIGYGIDDDGSLYMNNERLIKHESENFYIFEKDGY